MNKKELKKAFEEGLITKEQFQEELFKIETAPKQPRKRKKAPVFFNDDEFVALIKVIPKKYIHHRVAFLLAFVGGLRVSEIVGGKRAEGLDDIPPLTKERVDMKARRMFIKDAKGGKDRAAPLPKQFKEKHLKLLPISQFCGARALQAALVKYSRKAGLLEKKPGLHFHSLRHGFVSESFNRRIPAPMIRDAVGHASLATTNRYAHVEEEKMLRTYEEEF